VQAAWCVLVATREDSSPLVCCGWPQDSSPLVCCGWPQHTRAATHALPAASQLLALIDATTCLHLPPLAAHRSCVAVCPQQRKYAEAQQAALLSLAGHKAAAAAAAAADEGTEAAAPDAKKQRGERVCVMGLCAEAGMMPGHAVLFVCAACCTKHPPPVPARVWPTTPSHTTADSPISLDDQAALRLYYQVKLKAIVAAQQLPSKVLVCVCVCVCVCAWLCVRGWVCVAGCVLSRGARMPWQHGVCSCAWVCVGRHTTLSLSRSSTPLPHRP
jgi:hypothetical protein